MTDMRGGALSAGRHESRMQALAPRHELDQGASSKRRRREWATILEAVEPPALASTRRLVRTFLEFWGLGHFAPLVEFGVTELLANVLEHAHTACEVFIAETAEGILVAVSDASNLTPVLRSADVDAESGRGLRLLAAMTTDFGFEPLEGGGKRVHFTVTPHDVS